MREDNLLCVRHRAFVVTTDSRHNLPVYPNLARTMTLAAVNQLWVADITYIRLRTEFIYLAVVLDAYSRRVIGWGAGDGRWRTEMAVDRSSHGSHGTATRAGSGASLRSRSSVRLAGLHRDAETTSGRRQHEPKRQSL